MALGFLRNRNKQGETHQDAATHDHEREEAHHARAHRNREADAIDAADTTGTPVDIDAQHEKFGGFHVGAAFFGWLVAVGLSALLTGAVAALGSALALTANQSATNGLGGIADDAATAGLTGAILLILAMAIAYYAGGYVAGRMSRFDGIRQGIGVWAIGLGAMMLLALTGAMLGIKYNLLQEVNLPSIPVNEGQLSLGGIITLVGGLLATLGAAMFGGKTGENYHRKIDREGIESAEHVSHAHHRMSLSHR